MVALYQADVLGRPLADLLDRNTKPFTRELAEGVSADRERLDGLIERHSVGWPVERIAPVERSILRVALYELLHRPDVPAEVAIDQAVDAAKELCAAGAPAFVNGILGAVQRERVASP